MILYGEILGMISYLEVMVIIFIMGVVEKILSLLKLLLLIQRKMLMIICLDMVTMIP